jgi:putative membrane protein
MLGKLNGLMVVLAEVLLLTLPVAAQERPTGPDQQLVARLRELGQRQISVTEMGQRRGTRADVKSLAATLQRDQKAIDDKLLAYADRNNMNRAAIERPGDAMAHGTLSLAPLANSTPEAFDYNFAARLVADHQAAIDAAAAAERLARDPELKVLINGMLAEQSAHLVSAQELLSTIPVPPPRVPQLPGEPSIPSRTQTGADIPPAAALLQQR